MSNDKKHNLTYHLNNLFTSKMEKIKELKEEVSDICAGLSSKINQ